MRGKKSILNTFFSLLEEIVSIVCAFILPKLILQYFGSEFNGLINSITQFLACAVVLRSGIGGATRAALYKPLAEKNSDKINSIIKATDMYMKKIGIILACGILLFATAYPFVVNSDFDWFFTFSLFIIIGISTFAESYFGITYLILVQSDQKLWVSSLIRIICLILNVILASILIISGYSIHIVKLGSAFAFALYPVILNIYVKKKYKINLNVEPDNDAIGQRWDAFWHQFATFITNNTDVVVLSIFTNMIEVSVYSVYMLVINGIKRIITSFSNGIEAAFGNMIAKKEEKSLKENFSLVEFIIYNISTIVYGCSIALILQFVNVYTINIKDADYLKPLFSYILLLATFMTSIRMPYQLIIQAAGKYKETKNGAIFEAFLNIIISVVLVINFGLIGVSIGTFVSTTIRTVELLIYANKNIIHENCKKSWLKMFLSLANIAVIVYIWNLLKLSMPNTYFVWIKNAIIIVILAIVSLFIVDIIFYNKELKLLLKKLKLMKKKKM